MASGALETAEAEVGVGPGRSPSAGQSLHDHVFLVNEFMTAGKQPAEGRALAN
jgi:hypothetical protein